MIDLVLPCLDEAAALPWVLARIPAGVRPIVVDNGSTDGSAELAAALGASVIECPVRGYGAACHTGLQAATAEFVGFCDCDASMDPRRLTALAAAVIDGSADLVLGRRRPEAAGAWPAHARVANAALSWWLRTRLDLSVHDIGPMRIGRRTELLALDQLDRHSGYPLETVVLAAKAGWRISEADLAYRPRSGRSKVTGTWSGTLRAVRDMSAVLAR